MQQIDYNSMKRMENDRKEEFYKEHHKNIEMAIVNNFRIQSDHKKKPTEYNSTFLFIQSAKPRSKATSTPTLYTGTGNPSSPATVPRSPTKTLKRATTPKRQI